MTFHLHGNILTASGIASNNRGKSNSNIATLHKFKWKQRKTYTRISSEAIRWALRYYWQEMGYAVYRFWDANEQNYIEQNSHDPDKYIDDDVMGYLELEATKKEVNDSSESKKKTKKIPQKPIQRTGVLKVTSAVSLLPYFGDVTFNARAGEKDETSLYGSEYHATRYQYGFSLTPKRLVKTSRILQILDGVISLYEVGGNHSRFLYDFAAESLIFRWTHDVCPRILYSFDEDSQGNISVPDLVWNLQTQNIAPHELWIGGRIAESLSDTEAHTFVRIEEMVEHLKRVITEDLELENNDESANSTS